MVYQRFTARGAVLLLRDRVHECRECARAGPGPARRTRSRSRPSACGRFSPGPAPVLEGPGTLAGSLGGAAPRLGAHRHPLAVRRDRQRRQALLLTVPDPGGGSWPGTGLAEPLRVSRRRAVICSSCRLPMLTPVAASTNSRACWQEPDRLNICASAAAARNTPAAAGSAPRRAGTATARPSPRPGTDPPHHHLPQPRHDRAGMTGLHAGARHPSRRPPRQRDSRQACPSRLSCSTPRSSSLPAR